MPKLKSTTIKEKKDRTGKVYKITSPSGKVYIGSTIQPIQNRWCSYKRKKCKDQVKLFRSFEKYGVDSHTFEVIWEGLPEERLKHERIFGDLYNVLDKERGLNLKLPGYGDVTIVVSDETKQKMSEGRKGTKHHNYGKKASSELKKKFTESRLGALNHRYGKKGVSCKTSTKLNQYTLDGVYLNTFDNYSIAQQVTGVSRKAIRNCVTHKSKSASGYLWTKFNEE